MSYQQPYRRQYNGTSTTQLSYCGTGADGSLVVSGSSVIGTANDDSTTVVKNYVNLTITASSTLNFAYRSRCVLIYVASALTLATGASCIFNAGASAIATQVEIIRQPIDSTLGDPRAVQYVVPVVGASGGAGRPAGATAAGNAGTAGTNGQTGGGGSGGGS